MTYKKEIVKATIDTGIYRFFDINSEYKFTKADKLEYHEAVGEGDKHYVDVTKDGQVVRYFNIVDITFKPKEDLK